MGVLNNLINRKNNKSAENYCNMSHDELLRLTDSKLEDAISVRIQYEEEQLLDEDMEWNEDLQVTMNEAQCTYDAVSNFVAEMTTAGLEGFFDSDSRKYAKDICHSLKTIGAEKISDMLKTFMMENNIDVIEVADINNCIDLGTYDFASFDKVYEQLIKEEPIDENLMQFVRQNIEEF